MVGDIAAVSVPVGEEAAVQVAAGAVVQAEVDCRTEDADATVQAAVAVEAAIVIAITGVGVESTTKAAVESIAAKRRNENMTTTTTIAGIEDDTTVIVTLPTDADVILIPKTRKKRVDRRGTGTTAMLPMTDDTTRSVRNTTNIITSEESAAGVGASAFFFS